MKKNLTNGGGKLFIRAINHNYGYKELISETR